MFYFKLTILICNYNTVVSEISSFRINSELKHRILRIYSTELTFILECLILHILIFIDKTNVDQVNPFKNFELPAFECCSTPKLNTVRLSRQKHFLYVVICLQTYIIKK